MANPNLSKLVATTIILFHFAITNAQNFIDIASGVGINNTFGNVTYGGGVSFADFDKDGWDDLTYTTGTGQQMAFYKNSGNGYVSQTDIVSNTTETKQPLWVDYDNDGDMDLWVSSNQLNRLYRNDGDLSMTDVTATCGFSDPTVVSFNGVWLDYDEDGFLDLVTSHRLAYLVGELTLYHNLGDGTFEDLTDEAGLGGGIGNSVLGMATLDYNNDGWEDIFVGQDFEAGCLLLKNMGDGTFDNVSLSSGANIENDTMSATIGDFDNNGYMDVFITDTGTDGCSLLSNQGDETFVDVALEKGVLLNLFTWGASFFDADCDMDLDLNIDRTSGSPYTGLMFENINGGETFTQVNNTWGFGNETGASNGNAVGDCDNDGYPDLAKNNTLMTNSSLWRNNFSANNFLKVQLTGTISNIMAVGSVIHLYAGGVHQMRRIGCGEGFSSQHSYVQMFGMANHTTADSLIVNWTNGMRSSYYNIEANQLLELIENPIAGCMDEMACNYDQNAVEDGNNCVYALPYHDCFLQCINDTDMDGFCDELEIPGCMDATACNYNPAATDIGVACEYETCYGCTDSNADNFNPDALYDDSSCTYSCVEYVFTLSTDCWSSETSWVILNPFGDVAYSSDDYLLTDSDTMEFNICLATNCGFVFYVYDSYGDGLNGSATGCDVDGNYFLTDNSGNIVFAMDNPDFDTEILHSFCAIHYGCMDELACNYDPLAEASGDNCNYPPIYYSCDGNCINDIDSDTICDEMEIPGCTDENACNFNPAATDDDGSCSTLTDNSIAGPLDAVVGENINYSCVSTPGSEYQWLATGGTIVSGQGSSEIILTWNGPGTGTLGVTETNDAGCLNVVTPVMVNIVQVAVGESSKVEYHIFPNPVNDKLVITGMTSSNPIIELFDIYGRLIPSLFLKSDHEQYLADMRLLPAGYYMILVHEGNQNVRAFGFVKQ